MAVQNPVLYNAALSGFVAGITSKRLLLTEPDGAQSEPVDFAAIVAAGVLFATEVDAVLQTVESPPTNIGSLSNPDTFATIVPATAAVANAAQSLPCALSEGTKGAWQGRNLPLRADGTSFHQTDYQPVASLVVAQFVQFATATDNS